MKFMLFANTDWYLYNFRRSLAIALHERGHEVVLVSPAGPFGEKLRAMGLRWLPSPMDRVSLNPLHELHLVRWLRRLVVHEGVDLIHGFTIKCAIYGAMAGQMAGLKGCVSSVAGMGYVFTSNDPKARLLRRPVRSLMKLALDGASCRVILQNPDDMAFFEKAGLVDPSRLRLIAGSGVDCRRFVPSPPRPLSTTFRVVLPARLLWDKGVGEYVEAARILRAGGRDIELCLAGTPDAGNPAAVPEPTIRGWVDEGLVTWLGHVDDMPGLFAGVDAVVLPSYREGLPKALIEAGACALPLVTTDVPGCRDVVTDDVDGLLVPVRDAGALAGAIARLQDDADLRRRLGQAAREKVLALFDEQIVVRRTIDVYRELLGDDLDVSMKRGR